MDMVRECIDSVLALSLSRSEKEIIIVDDGSQQCPMPELMAYCDDIIYLRQPNRGLSAARNIGLDIATSKYIQFIDGDDKIVSNIYEQCLDLARFKDPDMVLFDYTDTDSAKPKIKNLDAVDGTVFMNNNNIHASAWGYLFRKDILMGLKFSPGILHEDEEFTPQLLLRAEKVYDTDYKAYFYRKRTGSITTKKDKKHILKRLNDFEQIIKHLHDISTTLPMAESTALQRRVAQLTMDYIYNIIKMTKSQSQLETRLMRLQKVGLYPLPDRDYSQKYIWFRKLANSKTGLYILRHTLTLIK